MKKAKDIAMVSLKLAVCARLGIDLGDMVFSLNHHFAREPAQQKTVVWEDISGNDLVMEACRSETVKEHLPHKEKALQVRGALAMDQKPLKMFFFSRVAEPKGKKDSLHLQMLVGLRAMGITDEVQLRVPLKNGDTDLSLMIDTHESGRGWTVDRAWIEIPGENAVCVPVTKESALV